MANLNKTLFWNICHIWDSYQSNIVDRHVAKCCSAKVQKNEVNTLINVFMSLNTSCCPFTQCKNAWNELLHFPLTCVVQFTSDWKSQFSFFLFLIYANCRWRYEHRHVTKLLTLIWNWGNFLTNIFTVFPELHFSFKMNFYNYFFHY